MTDTGGFGWRARAKLGFGLAILTGLLLWVSPAAILTTLTSVRPLPAAVAVAVVLLGQLAVALRFRVLARAGGFDASTRQSLEIHLVASFYGLFVPGGNVTAGAVRLHRLSRLGDGGLGGALPVVFRDRFDATVGLILVGLAFLLMERPVGSPATPVILGAAVATGVGMALLVVVSRARPFRVRGGDASSRWRRWRGQLAALANRLGGVPPRSQMAALSLSVVAHVLGVFTYVLLARSMELDISSVTLGWVRSGVVLLTMLPVSVGGVGVREAAFLLLLADRDIGAGSIVAFSLLVFAVTVACVAALGGLVEAWRSVSVGWRGVRR